MEKAMGMATETAGFEGLVGKHPSMMRVFELIRRVAPSTAPVLVTGESGTGKELVARAIHALSPRRTETIVPVHCGAIPEELLESELFGHVRGAFTGATNARTGRFRLAHSGTIFLDEIGEMSPRFQVKLLRVLEDGTFEQVGGTNTERVDVRVVAATHRDLSALAASGSFRTDLLYRLDVVSIHLPALRERREDIPLIARHFLSRLSAKGFPRFDLPDETAGVLMDHEWPGNVRELRNVLERAVLLSDGAGVLRPRDLPAPFGAGSAPARVAHPAQASPAARALSPAPVATSPVAGPAQRAEKPDEGVEGPQAWEFGPAGTDFYAELDRFERLMIGRALELSRGSKREAARLLQVNRTTLLEKIKRKGWNSAGLEAVSPPPQQAIEASAEITGILADPDWTVPSCPSTWAQAAGEGPDRAL